MLKYSTAGESHGKSLLALIDGFPAGLTVDEGFINHELHLRQGGYGRGGRQKLEQDTVNILSGTWQSVTLGSPIAMQIVNNDYKLERLKELERPRPGHADLTGAIKYLGSIRGVLERSSARETAARVAAGALARLLLREFGIETVGYVVELGEMTFGSQGTKDLSIHQIRDLRDSSSLYSVQPQTDPDAQAYIDRMADEGDTLGGIVEVRSQARWQVSASGHGRAGDQGGRDRDGVRGGSQARFTGSRSDPTRSEPIASTTSWVCSSNEQRWRTRRWHDQWSAPDLKGCKEAN